MNITIHGEILSIPESLAHYARTRLTLAIGRRAGSVRRLVVRLVQLRDDAPPHWVAVADLGQRGTAVARTRAVDRLAALDELARRMAISVEHRLSAPPIASSGRVVTRILA
jgi:hypothetical protein